MIIRLKKCIRIVIQSPHVMNDKGRGDRGPCSST